MELLMLDRIAAFRGEPFETTVAGAPFALTLTGAEPLPDTNVPGGRRDPFLLTFHSPSQEVLPQGIYTLSHPEFGDIDIFFVPTAGDSDGVTYQAVFN